LNRREVRSTQVPLVWALVHLTAGSPSPEPHRRRCPPCAATHRRCHLGMSLLSSRVCARRPGEGPAATGATPRRPVFAPPFACVAPPQPAPPPAALRRCRLRRIGATGPPIYGPDQFDPESNLSLPVNLLSRARIRSPPLDLDPAGQIHPSSLTTRFRK
jgi:hypothetical protein